MNKLFALYICISYIAVTVLVALTLPSLAILIYLNEGLSWAFIFISTMVILIEPLVIWALYLVLTSIKDIYNDLRSI